MADGLCLLRRWLPLKIKTDDAIREAVLGNDEAGTNDPFLGDLFLLDEEGF